jgi:hypothetical protein
MMAKRYIKSKRIYHSRPSANENLMKRSSLLSLLLLIAIYTSAKIHFKPRLDGERVGFIIMGHGYAYLSAIKKVDGIYLTYNICKQAEKGNDEIEKIIDKITMGIIYLRVSVSKHAKCSFSYSTDNIRFTKIEESFIAQPGKWIGAKMGFFSTRNVHTNDSGLQISTGFA